MIVWTTKVTYRWYIFLPLCLLIIRWADFKRPFDPQVSALLSSKANEAVVASGAWAAKNRCTVETCSFARTPLKTAEPQRDVLCFKEKVLFRSCVVCLPFMYILADLSYWGEKRVATHQGDKQRVSAPFASVFQFCLTSDDAPSVTGVVQGVLCRTGNHTQQ